MADKAAPDRAGFVIDSDLSAADPYISQIVEAEEARQAGKLVMIPSESIAPLPVREVLGSVFTNIYAEGYPALRTTREEEAIIANVAEQLALHRRYADRRYYKGTELANLVEALAQHRVARLFAANGIPADRIFANVQPLSGAAANNAVYEALLRPGDTLLGMALSHGGHLSHGSPYNRSGRYYNVVPYTVDPRSGRIDYDAARRLALEHRPRIIVGGASAYPWDIDWSALRAIAGEVGAYLLADIAHPAGLVVAGLFPNPIGFADAVTFTTHKTLCGPRGAVILCTDEELSKKIDRAVFPGEQGGPHLNNIAAMAVAFHLARGSYFQALQRQIVANARALAAALKDRGLSLVYGGTNTHLLLVDLNAIPSPTGCPLKGDVASRILDVAGIVSNKNAIPGDVSAGQSSGIRFGTVWVTQRGMREPEMERLAELIQRALASIEPFCYIGPDGDIARGKLPFPVLREVRQGVAALCAGLSPASAGRSGKATREPSALEISGPRAKLLLQEAGSANILPLAIGASGGTLLLEPSGEVLAALAVTRVADDRWQRERYLLAGDPSKMGRVEEWLRALSDGYVLFDPEERYGKIDGPAVIAPAQEDVAPTGDGGKAEVDLTKPYFVGQRALLQKDAAKISAKEEFRPAGYEGPPRPSCLYDEHLKLNRGRNMVPFAGWLMPIWYTSIREEHRAVRETAGIFDISHMGVFEVRGPNAARFLDLVTTNFVPMLLPGQSHYSYLLDVDGNVLDDVFLYCRARDRYMLVANAANAERVEAWLRAASSRRHLIDRERPGIAVDAQAEIVNLKDPSQGDEGRVDIALQGPASLQTLLAALDGSPLAAKVAALQKAEFVEGTLAGVPALISRTGYTGADIGFEIYVPPGRAAIVWRLLLEKGTPLGVRAAGLGARDSTRTEAGFPLYGHELAGRYQISPSGAGYGQFVKLHKPFFVGRRPFIASEEQRRQEVARFRLSGRGARMLHMGDPVVNQRGECLGHVTSSVVVDGVQIGMAYLTRGLPSSTPLRIFPLARWKDAAEKPKGGLEAGDVTLLPEDAVVLPRFGLRVLHQ